MQEAVRVGMKLGTANGVAEMKWFKNYGWIAYDPTGCAYSQKPRPDRGEWVYVHCPDGLSEYVGPGEWLRQPWPPRPQKKQ